MQDKPLTFDNLARHARFSLSVHPQSCSQERSPITEHVAEGKTFSQCGNSQALANRKPSCYALSQYTLIVFGAHASD